MVARETGANDDIGEGDFTAARLNAALQGLDMRDPADKAARAPLPVLLYRDEIVKAVRENLVTIINVSLPLRSHGMSPYARPMSLN